jgi:serpin B
MKRFLILHVFGALLVTMAHGETSFDLAAKATNELGVDLHRQLASGSDQNLCISPYSIDSALAMTFAGADGETRNEMARVLHFPNGGDLPFSFSALQHSLEQMSAKTAELVKESKKFGGPSEPITLNIANRLFAQKGYHFREAYLSLVKQ